MNIVSFSASYSTPVWTGYKVIHNSVSVSHVSCTLDAKGLTPSDDREATKIHSNTYTSETVRNPAVWKILYLCFIL